MFIKRYESGTKLSWSHTQPQSPTEHCTAPIPPRHNYRRWDNSERIPIGDSWSTTPKFQEAIHTDHQGTTLCQQHARACLYRPGINGHHHLVWNRPEEPGITAQGETLICRRRWNKPTMVHPRHRPLYSLCSRLSSYISLSLQIAYCRRIRHRLQQSTRRKDHQPYLFHIWCPT